MNSFRETVADLKDLSPDFVSLTYGAMGNTEKREQTIETARMLKHDFTLETAAHLTCMTHTRDEIEAILQKLHSYGIENIVALRGDAPKEAPAKPLEQRDYRYADDLVKHIKQFGHFDMAVAGYPETHCSSGKKYKKCCG